MKNLTMTFSLLIMAALQVACSDDNKKMSYAEWCAKVPSCAATRAIPQNTQALAGSSAVANNPQVLAAADQKNTQAGQVPNPAYLPVSIEERSRQIAATMNAMDSDPDFALVNGTRTLVNSNYVPTSVGGGSSAEITVASVPEHREPAQAAPTYSAPVADPNSVFSQPEASGVGTAH